ncbi:glycosyltransferase family 87 protein [Corynebacterium propinquum]|uniref:Glycosyltransferase 87 family protein n=1 Tax=Corynebacterium propinquum TaxID=43769 RepID=A0ABT7G3J6_9CORY|nr:glycosyltransferase 87 family protein [Corynebacterium propinquum]MCT1819126.1 glycosyltransferase 87 family protein [Corynebacterium propinquum]MDK4258812.1 glycosyltransferase 87 family protein [Corynebacterium propinquum]MDK4281813.1 glycosyltransferase 87 family protein [Corynebacterium propinquum]MDK4298326.1 glycosyltransferase 87 family protein [Corynebacterium propinquum]MDK4301314.1 glycosyltransferase 87 family protein [Corynebacterium propinquum]
MTNRAGWVAPAETEPAARKFIDFLGGPVDKHGRLAESRWFHPVQVIVSVAMLFLAGGFLTKAHCTRGSINPDTGAIDLDWSGNRAYVSACYNDIIPLFAGRGLDTGGFPYAYSWQEDDVTRYLEYPVLTGYFQGIMGWLARVSYPPVEAVSKYLVPVPMAGWYFILTVLVLSLFWVATVRMACALAGRRIWDIMLVAASPLVLVHAFTNWDILAIFFAVAGLLLFARGRTAWAGVAIGLGTATKLWPLFLLGAIIVLALRLRRFRALIIVAITTAVTWLVVNLPVMLAYPEAWNEFNRLNSTRSWEWTTIYAVAARLTLFDGFDPDGAEVPQILNTVSLALFIASCVAIAILGLVVKRQPRMAELVFLIIAAFLLFNKVWSPQYSLWLVIPAVLAFPRWRLLLTWMAVDMLVWPVLMWHMHGADNNGLPAEFLDVVVLTRTGLIVVLVVCVVRQMLGKNLPGQQISGDRNQADPVYRAHNGYDPLAGPLQVTPEKAAEHVGGQQTPETRQGHPAKETA